MLRPATDLRDRAAARHELELRRARTDFAAFVEFVFGFALGDHHHRWCSAVQEYRRVVVLSAIEHGKTSVVAIALPLFTLGQNPDARIAIVFETATQAERVLAAIREHILRNDRLREVFPELRPAGGARAKWADAEIVIARPATSKDPSVVALGMFGPLLGARLDLAILDDVLSFGNTLTDAQRKKVIGWFKSTLVGRIVETGRIVVAGSAWHREDLLHALADSGEYRVLRDPAIKEDGTPLWPEQWPLARLAQRRREIGEVEFSRQFLVQTIADGSSRFREEAIEEAFAAAAKIGAVLVDRYVGESPTFTGVDLGIGRDAHHDESVIFTLTVRPDGRRQVLGLDAGRWAASEIVERIKSVRERYGGTIRVESNGAQQFLVQFCESAGIHVEAHTTSARNKHDPVFGIEGMAVDFDQGRWVVPDAPATRAWARELLSYTPASHAGDRVMASWLANEAARHAEGRQRPAGIVQGTSIFDAWGTLDEDDPFDDGLWVLGPPNAGRPRRIEEVVRTAPVPIAGSAARPTARRPLRANVRERAPAPRLVTNQAGRDWHQDDERDEVAGREARDRGDGEGQEAEVLRRVQGSHFARGRPVHEAGRARSAAPP